MPWLVEKKSWPLPNGCWLWMGATSSDGYGRTTRNRRSVGAHQIAHGPVDPGQQVMHTCDNRWCVNPDHLVAGTVAENNLAVWRRGGRSRERKLSPELAAVIRAANGSQRAIATRFGINQSNVSRIKSGTRYGV